MAENYTNILKSFSVPDNEVRKYPRGRYLLSFDFWNGSESFYYSTDNGVTWYEITDTFRYRSFLVDADLSLWICDSTMDDGSVSVTMEELAPSALPFPDVPIVAGTWTPIITGSTTNPVLSYTTQTGSYQLIGNLCFYTFQIILDTVTSAGSGTLRVSLPFTSADSTDWYGITMFSGVDFSNTDYVYSFKTANGVSYGTFRAYVDNGSYADMQLGGTLLASNDRLIATGFYRIV
jgi:hypothetical protein